MRRKKTEPAGDPGTRDERKQRTRRALMDGALQLLAGERSFSSLSLREVAKVAGVVPAAFYRHFSGMDDLGLALVDDAFGTLHDLMREARAAPLPASNLIANSMETFLRYAATHRLQFQFLAKERFSGSSTVRLAIRKEIRLWVSELAADLAAFPKLKRLNGEDLRMVTGLVVQCVMGATELLLDADPENHDELDRIQRNTGKQVMLIFLGAAQWKSPKR
ncbi:TetR family transcriptional regulator [Flagellatimonas centrodinii]|uniref:TetR family transcriptional regulator n=1 Tax=Flagellatimonas centrodinii TaxID=2806210 RepID=UPI001FEFEA98|nr:TetR family transcriptional regulator [Flagellatimonas centrodinii]ULQ45775.1 TetR family transcriptional regulator [Flagellatimonas centrodinii]